MDEPADSRSRLAGAFQEVRAARAAYIQPARQPVFSQPVNRRMKPWQRQKASRGQVGNSFPVLG